MTGNAHFSQVCILSQRLYDASPAWLITIVSGLPHVARWRGIERTPQWLAVVDDFGELVAVHEV